MSLLDFPGKICATIFTNGCNFRCPFCHNASLVLGGRETQRIDEDEIFDFLKKRVGLLDGVCVTGGEPLLQPDIDIFISKIKELGFAVKLDSNGSMPVKLRMMLNSGLIDYVAMDIKNSLAKYPMTVGLNVYDTAPIEESVALLMEENVPYEFRTTVVAELHQPQDIVDIGKWLNGAPRYFLQSFKDSGDLILPDLHGVSHDEIKAMAESVRDFFGTVEIRGI